MWKLIFVHAVVVWPKKPHQKAGTIDLQVTYEANVLTADRKANVRLVYDNRKTEVWFVQSSHGAGGNPSLTLL